MAFIGDNGSNYNIFFNLTNVFPPFLIKKICIMKPVSDKITLVFFILKCIIKVLFLELGLKFHIDYFMSQVDSIEYMTLLKCIQIMLVATLTTFSQHFVQEQ